MVIPALVWMVLINIVPMFGIIMAFQDFNPGKGIFRSKFIGLENFEYMFQLKDVSQIFTNTIVIAVGKLLLNVLVPVIFALLLNEIKNVAFKRCIQTVVYLPHFISWVIMGGILLDVFGLYGSDQYGTLGFRNGAHRFFPNLKAFPDPGHRYRCLERIWL